jgi:GNAT superfamily N-acetyltransferase
MEISPAKEKHILPLIHFARYTWHHTYDTLVAPDQVDYMLNLFYTEEVLWEQLNDPKHHIYVLTENETLLAYMHCVELGDRIKLSKFYVLPEQHGKGLGKQLMRSVEELCLKLGYHAVELCVNRGNPAQYFYEKLGFAIKEQVDIPVGPYWMNDYLMVKPLAKLDT